MTCAAQQALDDARRIGLRGFGPPPAADPDIVGADDATSASYGAIMALGRRMRIAGFAHQQRAGAEAVGAEAAFARATRLGLPGFGEDPAPDAPAVTVSVSRPVAATPSPNVASSSPPKVAAPAQLVTKQPFAIIQIAPGAHAAFTALEAKMGRPFASPVAGRSSWLQRDAADGGQTRAYPVTGHEMTTLQTLAGPLGDPGIELSVGGITRSDFAIRSSSGDAAAGSHPSVMFIDAEVPGALRKAIGR